MTSSPYFYSLFNSNYCFMKKTCISGLVLVCLIVLLQYGCNESNPSQTSSATEKKELSHAELIQRGKYLVNLMGCEDCHSPKIMTPQGPVPDSNRALSGHPAGSPLPPIDKKALQPGYWILFAGDLTAMTGPWGISFPANLTPDSATGLGAWTADIFIKTLRTGKHLGQDGGRPILPPMPWQNYSRATDEDLKAVFAYLQALPAIRNKVPEPVSPPDVGKMN
jgi:hypothetical protein